MRQSRDAACICPVVAASFKWGPVAAVTELFSQSSNYGSTNAQWSLTDVIVNAGRSDYLFNQLPGSGSTFGAVGRQPTTWSYSVNAGDYATGQVVVLKPDFGGALTTLHLSIDNVSITGDAAVATVPEGTSWTMFIVGLGITGLVRRQQQARESAPV